MLAPGAEIRPGEAHLWREQVEAVATWRTIPDRLGISASELGLSHRGTVLVGWDPSDRRAVRQFAAVASEMGAPLQEIRREDRPDAFVGLSPRLENGLMLDGDGQVDPDRVVAALNEALAARRVTRLEGEAVVRESPTPTVEVSGTVVTATHGVIATGATPLPTWLAERTTTKIRPIRGTTVRVEGIERSEAPTLRAIIRGRPFYFVSRADGTGVLGATAVEGSNARVEVAELAELLRDATDLVPALAAASIVETRSGLRPVSPDGAPFIEALPDSSWFWSSGHFRHGVTLAPLYGARLVREMGL
jgi:glycine oxidase